MFHVDVSTYVYSIIEKLMSERGAIKYLKDFEPLSSDNMKRAKRARDKLPGELLIKEQLMLLREVGASLLR